MSILIKGIDMPEKHHMDCYYIDHDGRVLNISRNKVIGEAIQYEERKKGKWNRLRSDTFHCKFCGTTFTVTQGENNMNFCPNCGARMEGEEHGT